MNSVDYELCYLHLDLEARIVTSDDAAEISCFEEIVKIYVKVNSDLC
jgi:hypothetical protein